MTLPANKRLIRHILCPIDFSATSKTALRYAAVLAGRNSARLTVLFVNDPLLGAAAAAADYDVRDLAAKTDAELRRFATGVIGDTVAVSRLTTSGDPAQETNKAAERLGADLVVMGSRGLTGFGKWMLGSTTERVLRTATRPVLVVPLAKEWAKAQRTWFGKRVLVPVDLADYNLADLRAAIKIVRAFAAAPLLANIVPPARFPSWLKVDSQTYERDRVAAAQTKLEQIARTVADEAECRVMVGDPAEQIAAGAIASGAGLIVLTLKRAATRFGPRRGTIAYRVLSHGAAPILAMPERRRS
jgi:nucleotide-binding universal stress UspA family protein